MSWSQARSGRCVCEFAFFLLRESHLVFLQHVGDLGSDFFGVHAVLNFCGCADRMPGEAAKRPGECAVVGCHDPARLRMMSRTLGSPDVAAFQNPSRRDADLPRSRDMF
jgi:hypothetical protein